MAMSSDDRRPAFVRGTGFLLSRLGSLASRSWAAFLAAHDLTQSQYAVLVVLNEQGPVGQQHLAQLVAVDARNIVQVLDSLAARELIHRQTDPADRRRRIITLAPSGIALAGTLGKAAGADRSDFLAALGESDRQHLNDLLQRLYDSHVRES
jgi:MarR family transcriptional regulator, lower aerobic nicotinate degradation pathway regulator